MTGSYGVPAAYGAEGKTHSFPAGPMIKPEDIAVGDVVRLKSGSPKMLVSKIERAIGAPIQVSIIMWHENHGFIEDTFPLEFLVWPRNVESDA